MTEAAWCSNGTLIECSTLITDVGFDFDARVQSMEAFQ